MPSRSEPSQLGFRPPSSSPLYYLELAKQRLADGDAQGALEATEAAVDRSDGHPQYLRMLGGICLRLGYHRKAAEAYGYEPRVTCIEVPEVDHSFTTFCERGALAQRVFAALFDVSLPVATDSGPASAPGLAQERACGHG